MWNAFGTGSGVQGSGGGYVPSQGWEFIPGCTRAERADRGRGKSRSPMRRISSPPTVFSHICEPHTGASQPLEPLSGQNGPGHEPQQQQQQTQHMRLKKKFEDLKRRHGHDKDAWMREKELLLREVADIQGGENRRILLDLKSVLEEVQAEVKREEEKRSELQLQYTRDKCGWELEKAELKCRIAQLEAREGKSLVNDSSSSAFPRRASEPRGEAPGLCREREEQRTLLADARTAAMDLRCRLDHSERGWLRERAELLERFDSERSEWENQLGDMQRKIEELYCEVRAKRAGTSVESRADDGDTDLRLSVHSTSTGSSLLSDQSHSERLSSSSQSEVPKRTPCPGFYRRSNISIDGSAGSHHSPCATNTIDGIFPQSDRARPGRDDEIRGRDARQGESAGDRGELIDPAEMKALFQGAPESTAPQRSSDTSKGNVKNFHLSAPENPLCVELSYGTDRKKNTTLNAALKEIARVSEELCSYRRDMKSGDKRNRLDSMYLSEQREMLMDHVLEEKPCDLNQIYDDLRAIEKENWGSLSTHNTYQANNVMAESLRTTFDGADYERTIKLDAPPIPPRSSSWNLSSPTPLEPELYIPESPINTGRRCHSPCVLVDRKCHSPSVVRKFEAMLQENEGKVLTDGVAVLCTAPANSNCNAGCCHNRWSCDVSKCCVSKPPSQMPDQKSFSDVSILTAGKEGRSQCRPAVCNLRSPRANQGLKELSADVLLTSVGLPPPCSSPSQASRRNRTLEQKTAEFNRTLFQAEMGHGVEDEDSFASTNPSCVCSPSPRLANCTPEPARATAEADSHSDFQPWRSEVDSDVATASAPTSEPTRQSPETQMRGARCEPCGGAVRTQPDGLSDVSPQQAEVKLGDSAAYDSEVKPNARTPHPPSRQGRRRVATENLAFNHPVSLANTRPAQQVAHAACKSTSKKETSTPQPSAESRASPQTVNQPRHRGQSPGAAPAPPQSDSPRPAPRVMHDHPWKPLTLAAYPRPEGSRSNYGAVERILKSYESAAHAQQSQTHKHASSPNLSPGWPEEKVVERSDMLDMDPLPHLPAPRLAHYSHAHATCTHIGNVAGTVNAKEQPHATRDTRSSSAFSACPSIQRNFSRPACPANRRLPSRWASRSLSSSSSTSSSPSTTPVIPLLKHSSSFTHSQVYHMEIIWGHPLTPT